MNAGNQRADNANINQADFPGDHVDQVGIGQKEIKRRITQRSLYGTLALTVTDRKGGHDNPRNKSKGVTVGGGVSFAQMI